MAETATSVKLNSLTRADFQTIVNAIYPVGSIYMSANSTSPATLFGGTWTQIQNRFLLASGSKSLGATGGEENHTLSINEMPKHYHDDLRWEGPERERFGFNDAGTGAYRIQYSGASSAASTCTGYAGGGQPHNNMPPYLVVNVWQRTA